MFNKDKIIEEIGLKTSPSNSTIAVAMSGGVDSSVTAAILAECGYKVLGLSMHLYEHKVTVNKKRTCCAGLDISDARTVADKLKIPHYVLNYSNKFKEKVISDFADSYLKGETPIPCVKCNQTVKFEDMFEFAKKLGADALATGHYIKRKMIGDTVAMFRAKDLTKDQSYFLFATTKDQLEYLRFPLGGFEKSEIRRIAHHYDLKVADKPDSQDICFVPEGKYSDLVRKLRPSAVMPGDIVHIDGTILGKHNGIIDYTIGQRKGIKIGGRKGFDSKDAILYVIKIDYENNKIFVGPKDSLACKEIALKDCNWIVSNSSRKLNVLVKFRNSFEPVPAIVLREFDTNTSNIILKNPEMGISPGQAAVFYDVTNKDQVYGGGWINHTSLDIFKH